LGDFSVNLLEVFEKLLDVSTLERSNVNFFTETLDRLAVRYTPQVSGNSNIYAIDTKRVIDSETLFREVAVGGSLVCWEWGSITAGIWRLFRSIARLIGSRR
jgi:hypothetical protein